MSANYIITIVQNCTCIARPIPETRIFPSLSDSDFPSLSGPIYIFIYIVYIYIYCLITKHPNKIYQKGGFCAAQGRRELRHRRGHTMHHRATHLKYSVLYSVCSVLQNIQCAGRAAGLSAPRTATRARRRRRRAGELQIWNCPPNTRCPSRSFRD